MFHVEMVSLFDQSMYGRIENPISLDECIQGVIQLVGKERGNQKLLCDKRFGEMPAGSLRFSVLSTENPQEMQIYLHHGSQMLFSATAQSSVSA